MLKTFILTVALVALTGQAHSQQQPVETFSKCVAENTTGRDRKDLAKWMFVAMGAHPEMKAITTLPPGASEEVSKTAGRLFTRLVAEICAKDARAAVQAVGPVAIQSAFTVLGQLAMQELMADKDVAAGMSAVEKHIDNQKVQAVLTGK